MKFETVHRFGDFVQRTSKELHAKYYEEPFTYTPLPGPSYIRLLRIHPGARADELSCTMRAVDLDANPRYTALSYTWRRQPSKFQASMSMAQQTLKTKYRGKELAIDFPELEPIAADPESIKHTIHCNGKSFGLFPNLYESLLSFRSTGNCEGEFWIDQVCMNQEDPDERTAQVELMGQIYQNAELVQVWLGDCSDAVKLGLPALEELSKLSDDELPPFSSSEEPRCPEVSRAAVRKRLSIPFQDGKPPIDYASAAAFSITNRPWHKRIWVLQEFFLARNIVFFVGDHRISQQAIKTAFVWAYTNPGGSGKGSARMLSAVKALLMPLMLSHAEDSTNAFDVRASIAQGRRLTLREWIRTCSGRQATDPRDFVFGGLALMQNKSKVIERERLQLEYELDFEEPPPLPPRPSANPENQKPIPPKCPTPNGLWDAINVNYNASEAEVLVNLAACLLSQEEDHQFDLLSIAARPRDVGSEDDLWVKPFGNRSPETLPTWAPSLGAWSSRLRSDYASALAPSGGGSTRYAAGTLGLPRGTGPCPRISRDGSTLLLDALPLDIVDSNLLSLGDMKAAGLNTLLEAICQLPTEYSSSQISTFDAVARALASCMKDTSVDETDVKVANTETSSGSSFSSASIERNAPHWLCEFLESEVRYHVTLIRKKIQKDTEKQQNAKDAAEAKRKGGVIAKERKNLESLISDYWQLVNRFNDLPWSRTADQGETSLPITGNEPAPHDWEAEEYLAELDQNSLRGRIFAKYIGKAKSLRKRLDEDEGRTERGQNLSPGAQQFSEMFTTALVWRKVVRTKDGLIGITPMWMEPGDRVMLVKGAVVPYLFRHSDDDLKYQIKEIKKAVEKVEKRLKKATDGTAKMWQRISVEDTQVELVELRTKIESLEGKIGKRDAWILVGEAYVEGIMHGEILDRAGVDSFERIAVV